MAEEKIETVTGAEDAVCLVCMEGFMDPRTLDCGHYFCRACLQEILAREPLQVIKCPTCRAETKVKAGSGVKGLQRPYLTSLMEEVAGILSLTKKQENTKYCDVCGGDQKTAIHVCFDCRLNLCEKCTDIHKRKMSSHNSAPLGDEVFCKTHPNAISNTFCKDCYTVICGLCALKDHTEHQTETIEAAAAICSKRLEEFIKCQTEENRNEKLHNRIKAKLDEARTLEAGFDKIVSQTRGLQKQLENKLDQVERDTKAKLAAEIKTLVLYETDIKDLMDSKQSLIDHATYLTRQASKQELVEKERNFPTTKVTCLKYIESASIELPTFEENLTKICTQLRQIVEDCAVEFNKINVMGFSAGSLKKQNTIAVSHNVSSMTADLKRKRLVLRTNDANGPLKCYSYSGQLLESIGSGVTGLSADWGYWRGLCIDTYRDCYLAPCNSALKLINMAGQQIRSIGVGGMYNCGVAYSQENDTYILAEYNNQAVYLVNATTYQVIGQFSSPWSGPTQFTNPFNVHAGAMSGLKSPCIIVSDYGNNCIKLFDDTGNHVNTYGKTGTGDGEIQNPWGVSIDPEGRVVVCDKGNKRVASFWTDSAGKDRWECILLNDWKENAPSHLAMDTDSMIIGVVDGTYKTLHIYNAN